MKVKNVVLTILASAAVAAGAWAQTAGQVTLASNEAKGTPATAPAAAAPAPPPSVITAADVQALKDALAAQQLEIERLSQQLDRQQAQQAAAAAAKTATQSRATICATQSSSRTGHTRRSSTGQPHPSAEFAGHADPARQSHGESGDSHSLPRHHHHAGRIRGSGIRPAVKSAGSGPVHAI